MAKKKKKTVSQRAVSAIEKKLSNKKNVSPVSKIVRAKQKREAAMKKALGSYVFTGNIIPGIF